MIELIGEELVFSFPEVHQDARLRINFQRTLRIPDDGKKYPLPPGLGRFPLRHVDDYAKQVPELWLEHGGVMMPMYQSEAMWLLFDAGDVDEHWVQYPFAIKVAAGKMDAVTGNTWSKGLHRDPQNYMVTPRQPWLDGFCVEKGIIRQFVAMPLGAGYTAEEQLTDAAEHGGVQIAVYPMKSEVFLKRFPKFAIKKRFALDLCMKSRFGTAAPDMGLAPGGRMKQEIFEDPFKLGDWDQEHSSRCIIHIANSMVWRAITGEAPPTVPFTSREYDRAGLPWFEYYDDQATALEGSTKSKKLKSVFKIGQEKASQPLPENESVATQYVIKLRRKLRKGQVREFEN